MAKKVDIDLVKAVLQRNDMDVRLVSQILEEIQVEMNAMAEDEEKPPPVKKQHVFMLSDPKGVLEGRDFTGWIVQVPEEDSPFVAEERLFRAAYEYNTTPKGRRLSVKTIAEVCESVPLRVLKEQNVWVRTKEPIYVLRTAGKIPTVDIKAQE